MTPPCTGHSTLSLHHSLWSVTPPATLISTLWPHQAFHSVTSTVSPIRQFAKCIRYTDSIKCFDQYTTTHSSLWFQWELSSKILSGTHHQAVNSVTPVGSPISKSIRHLFMRFIMRSFLWLHQALISKSKANHQKLNLVIAIYSSTSSFTDSTN